MVRTIGRRSRRLDEEVLVLQYEKLAWALRALRWRSRGRFVRPCEAVIELSRGE